MGFLTQVRTTRLLRTNQQLGREAARFTGYIRENFTSPNVTAVLSNYVHEEDQNFKRSEMWEAVETAFAYAWDQALERYEDEAEGDSGAHVEFLSLLSRVGQYAPYRVHETLLHQHRQELVDRMIYLVKRG